MRVWLSLVGGCVTLVAAAAAGCYSGNDSSSAASPAGTTSPTDPGDGDEGSNATDPAAAAASGLPCDVYQLLASKCQSCHGDPLANDAPMPLLTYDDLAAQSKSNPAKTNAQVSLERMQSKSAPMPPSGPKATSTEIAAFKAWIAGGLEKGTCDSGSDTGSSGSSGQTGGGQQNTPTVCTSNKTWSSNREGVTMNPGKACIQCHQTQEGRAIVSVGGTVYPTVHEPDLCYGVTSGATVVITDAAGKQYKLPVGSTGNFSMNGTLSKPYSAKVVDANGNERAMTAKQSSGDCNSCHTEQGANGAPGRIFMP